MLLKYVLIVATASTVLIAGQKALSYGQSTVDCTPTPGIALSQECEQVDSGDQDEDDAENNCDGGADGQGCDV